MRSDSFVIVAIALSLLFAVVLQSEALDREEEIQIRQALNLERL